MLAGLRGFIFDLDGCVWSGEVLNPGARELLDGVGSSGRRLGFLSNNSRATGADLRARLHRLGVGVAEHVLTPLDIIGDVIGARWGRSRVLVIGAREMADAVLAAGHALIDVKEWRAATVVAVGNDFDLTYERLTAAARAAAAGAGLVTPNLDPRLPVEGGEFLPGCGAIVGAVATAAGVRPEVIGKPEPPLFRMMLARLGLPAPAVAMVGDGLASDIRGARAVGMPTVLYAPHGTEVTSEADVTVRSFTELAALIGLPA
ncbi:MAG TPA: HAD-IIA family hydrolase [Methylomirabilota bacterium]|nr:HAD-IIA family hydrolase [Methylomirabilota bacterium]